jgi:hypothetical protein
MMSVLTVRGCDQELLEALRSTSRRRGISVNRLIVETLKEVFVGDAGPRRYDDLADLAGTWSVAESAEFEAAVEPLRRIDSELWEQ